MTNLLTFSMPQPGAVHVDTPLTNLAIQYRIPGFISTVVAPVVPVKKESDKYFVFGREELDDVSAYRGIGTEANEITWNPTTATYSAEEYALKFLLPDRIVANSDTAIQPRMNTVNKITKKLWMKRERRVQAMAQSTSNFANAACAASWKGSSSDPEVDVDTAKEALRAAAGVEPNQMVMSSTVSRLLRRRLKKLSPMLMLDQEINFSKLPDRVWDLQPVIGGAVVNSAHLGQAASIADIWNGSVLVHYVDPSPSLDCLSSMYQLVVQDFVTKTWREEKRAGEMIEVGHLQAEQLVAALAGYLITGCDV